MSLSAGVTTANILAAVGALLAVASLPHGRQVMRAALIVTGIAGLYWSIDFQRGILIASGFGMLLVVNLLNLALALPRRGAIVFLPEESALATRSFASLSSRSFRELLDQGLWIHGQPGEILLEEGKPVSHLFWLSEGDVTIASGGREIAHSGPGHFFGELDVFSSTPRHRDNPAGDGGFVLVRHDRRTQKLPHREPGFPACYRNSAGRGIAGEAARTQCTTGGDAGTGTGVNPGCRPPVEGRTPSARPRRSYSTANVLLMAPGCTGPIARCA